MFKTGDKVRIKGKKTIYTVLAIPGEPEYDRKGFYDLNGTGCLIEKGWESQLNLELVETKQNVSLDSVVLNEDKKLEIQAAISQLKNNDLIFKEWGFSDVFEKGTAVALLFFGIPGTGKTLMAQAIADSIGAKLEIYGTADIESSEPGGAERFIRMLFGKPSKDRVMLFDECDSLLMDRNVVGPIIGAQVNALLQEIEKYNGIIIFTTNRLGKLDPALERRITTKVEFDFPDKIARKAIWTRLIPNKAPIGKDVDWDILSEFPLAGGNIKNAVLNAARMAAFQNSKEIHMDHFKNAIEKESESISKFVAAYEQSPHQSLVSDMQRTYTGIGLTKNDTMMQTSKSSKTKDIRDKLKEKYHG